MRACACACLRARACACVCVCVHMRVCVRVRMRVQKIARWGTVWFLEVRRVLRVSKLCALCWGGAVTSHVCSYTQAPSANTRHKFKHAHTHTHTHTYIHKYKHCLFLSLCEFLLSQAFSFTHTLSLSRARAHTHTHTRAFTHQHAHTYRSGSFQSCWRVLMKRKMPGLFGMKTARQCCSWDSNFKTYFVTLHGSKWKWACA